jgi:hypothetical protein
MVFQVRMDKWTSDEVFEWLHSTIRISEEKATIFRDEEVDGRALLGFTERRLQDDPFSLRVGPRVKIMQAINQFNDAPGKDLLLCGFRSGCNNCVFEVAAHSVLIPTRPRAICTHQRDHARA